MFFRKKRKPNRKQHHSTTRRPSIQCLERRDLMAGDVPRQAVLDFDGESLSKSDMQSYYSSSYGSSLTVNSFKSLFNSTRSYLDLNGDGSVNLADAEEAIDRIVDKVREDYAPYNLKIIVGDQDSYASMMTDSRPGDVTVMITGGNNVIDSQATAVGLAPVDYGNDDDNYAFVFGRKIADSQNTIDRFVNNVARTISHEMGHTFGLDHVAASSTNDASQHYLMNTGSARDFGNDFNFQDLYYTTDKGTSQNSHRILSDPDVLGPSNSAWAAVLTPGRLTINSGQEYGVAFWVKPSTTRAGDWDLINWGRWTGHTLDPSASPHINSLNPFDSAVTSIVMNGGDFNDHLEVFSGINVPVTAYGWGGNDTIYGGDAGDVLVGGDGDDHLYGRDGRDFLFGLLGDDYLDGGRDGFNDYLSGGGDNDTFVDYKVWVQNSGSWLGFWASEDSKTDYNSQVDNLIYMYPWS